MNRAASPDVRLEEVRGLDGLDMLEAHWRRLARLAPVPSFCHDFDWVRTFLAQQPDSRPAGTDQQLRLFVAKSGAGEIKAICPLLTGCERIRRVPFSAARLLALAHSSDVLCEPGELTEDLVPRLVTALRSAPEPPGILVFGPLSEGTDAFRAAESGRRVVPGAVRESSGGFRVIDTRGDPEEYYSNLGKNFRANLRKARNRLAKERGVEFRRNGDGMGIDEAYETLVAVEAASWKGEQGHKSALSLNPASRAFHGALARARSEDHAPMIHSLWISGRCIAAQLWVRYRSEAVAVKIGYDESFARLSPGQILFQKILADCFADPGVARVNLMTDQPWHEAWNAERVHCNAYYFPVSPFRGLLASGMLRLPRKLVHDRG